MEYEIDEFTLETAQKLLQEFWKEMRLASTEGRLTSSLITSKARDYNRKWNKHAETHLGMKPDGFKEMIKKQLSEEPLFRDQFATALKYL